MDVTIRDYRPDDWPAVCRVHHRSRPDELRGSFDARAFVPLAEDPEGEYINACTMFIAQERDEVVGFAGALHHDFCYYARVVASYILLPCCPSGSGKWGNESAWPPDERSWPRSGSGIGPPRIATRNG